MQSLIMSRLKKPTVATLSQHRGVVKDKRRLVVVRPKAADVAAFSGLEGCAKFIELLGARRSPAR